MKNYFKDFTIIENNGFKVIHGPQYNFVFNKSNGYMQRFGETKADDIVYSPIGPEILDIEISTSVHDTSTVPPNRLVKDGGCKGMCPFCYKNNGSNPTYNMTLEEFKIVFHKIANTVIRDNRTMKMLEISDIEEFTDPKYSFPDYSRFNLSPLTQIAFGIMNIDTNPDFFKMAEYCKSFGVAANFTMHGLDDISEDTAKYIANTFGACAVSVYDKDKSYDTIKKLTDAGMKQVNIHQIVYKDNIERVWEVIKDIKTDSRLSDMNALVLLSLKQKGRGENLEPLDTFEYDKIVKHVIENKMSIGFDSCFCNRFVDSARRQNILTEEIVNMSEPCESFGLFSSYISAHGVYFPCSFMEKACKDWMEGFDMFKIDNFLDDVWFSKKLSKWREKSLKANRSCLCFNV